MGTVDDDVRLPSCKNATPPLPSLLSLGEGGISCAFLGEGRGASEWEEGSANWEGEVGGRERGGREGGREVGEREVGGRREVRGRERGGREREVKDDRE